MLIIANYVTYFKVTVESVIANDLQRLYNYWSSLDSNNQWHELGDSVPQLRRFYLFHIGRIKEEKQAEITSYRRKIRENSQNWFSYMRSSRHYLPMIRNLEQDCAKLEQFEREVQQHADFMQDRVELNFEMQVVHQLLENRRFEIHLSTSGQQNSPLAAQNRRKGLSLERIQKFDHFQADESFTDETCWICLEDIKVGMVMIRLDCIGKHVFCKNCIEEWFTNQKTCPNCRFYFQELEWGE